MENPPKCPRCSADEVVPVVYGMPSAELIEQSRAGRVALGGDVHWLEAPEWRCVACGHEWGEAEAGA